MTFRPTHYRGPCRLDKQESIHGAQYTSLAFGRRCREAGVAVSMGSVGDSYDSLSIMAGSPAGSG